MLVILVTGKRGNNISDTRHRSVKLKAKVTVVVGEMK